MQILPIIFSKKHIFILDQSINSEKGEIIYQKDVWIIFYLSFFGHPNF